MRHSRLLVVLIALSSLSLAAHAATIDTFTISLTQSGKPINLSFSLPVMPSPYVIGTGYFITDTTVSGTGGSFTNEFFSQTSGSNGVDLVLMGIGPDLALYGVQLYSGSTFAPTFVAPGIYNVTDSVGDAGTITISQPGAAVTPEPSSLVLLGTGILALMRYHPKRQKIAASGQPTAGTAIS